MIYNVIKTILAVLFSLRAISFAVWQCKNRNLFGAAAVFTLAVSSALIVAAELSS